MSIRSLLLGLLEARVDFIVVGMAAGQMHGSRLLTENIDIVYKQDRTNIAILASYLNEIDAHVQDLWPTEGFASEFSLERLLDEKSLTLSSRDGEVDVLHRIDGIGEYDEVFTMSQSISLGSVSLRIITIDGLILSKRAANRPKDLLHLPDLECIRELKSRPPRGPALPSD